MKAISKIVFSSFVLLSLISCIEDKGFSSKKSNISLVSATFSNTPTKTISSSEEDDYFTVTFVNYDDSFLAEERVQKGQDAIYHGTVPTKPEDDEFTYTFKEWDKDLKSIVFDLITRATFDAIPKEEWSEIIYP